MLGKPISYLPAIMPERIALTDPTKQVAEIIGSGPFKFVAGERNPGALNVYEKFVGYVPRSEAPSYTSGAKIANFDRVEWHTLPDPATAAAALQAGEMDWWEQPTSDLAPLLRSNSDVEVQVTDPAGYCGLLRFNHLQPPFDNAAIRRAILGGIVQSDYMLGVVGDNKALWRDGAGFFQPDSPMASNVGLEAFSTKPDLDKVKAAVQAAGYKNERVVMLATADFPVINIMCQIAADMLAENRTERGLPGAGLGHGLHANEFQRAACQRRLERHLQLHIWNWPLQPGRPHLAAKQRGKSLRRVAQYPRDRKAAA